MKKTELINKATGIASRATLKLKKHSPEILLVTGVVGVVTSTVLACKATLKVNDILDESKETIDKIHTVSEKETDPERYSEDDKKKDLTIVYVQTGVKLVKLYFPAAAVGVASIVCLIASHNVLANRNTALGAAYATLGNEFNNYRERVKERYGEQTERDIKNGVKAKTFTETIVDETTGDTKEVEKTVDICDVDDYSTYARFFDEGSRNWTKNADYNLMFLKAQQKYFNDMLMIKHDVFLNEVYDALDIPRTKEGQVVGWHYDPKNPKLQNYIDFGIFNVNRETVRDFLEGYENVVLLDFNVDGNILGMMGD